MAGRDRQDLPTGLWMVATPIGNLGDITQRARIALERADFVLCEDTRRTRELLSALGISARGRLNRMDAHAESLALERWLGVLAAGCSLAVVSDAGTPGISDPGGRLARAALEKGIRVVPVPGASALAAFVSVAGLQGAAFEFGGFFPRAERERDSWWDRAARLGGAWVFLESPKRVAQSLSFLARREAIARVVAAKELTKVHERIFAGPADQVAQAVARETAEEGERGEWCFAMEVEALPGESADARAIVWELALDCLLAAGVAPSRASSVVARTLGVSRNLAYRRAIKKTGGGD